MSFPPAGYAEPLHALQKLIMQPVTFNDLSFVLLDALSAYHEPNWSMEEHRHPWFEFNYVSKGSLITTFNGRPFRIEAGQSFLIPPGIMHGHYHENGEEDDGFCLRWQFGLTYSENGQAAAFPSGSEWIYCLSQPRPLAIQTELNIPLLRLARGMSVSALQATVVHWLSGLNEAWRPRETEAAVQHRKDDHLLVQQTLLYLEEYYANEFKVQDIANALHVSYRNLSRIFKRETGLTLVEKLNDIRIREAKRLLKETKATLREIAQEVGLKNEFYLSNMFRRYALMSPTEFKLQNNLFQTTLY